MRVGGQVLGVLEVRCERARSREADWVPALADIGSLFALFLKRQRAEADLQRFARYDSLTGLPNRSFFLDTLDRTLSRAGRQRTRSALVFLDLDGFKAVNDGLGHAAGDTVLQTMAERLRAGTRSSDLVARIGGDEFTVLVQNLARADDAALVARGLLDRLARPCRADDHDVTLSASAGISVYPEDGTDADTLLRNADLAMYRSKQEGKNTYRFFTAEMSERALERMLLLDSLRVALERDEFEIVYLPVLHREGPPSLEALLRWRHPKLGLVTPAAFIGQAEESGLILPIGAGVLRGATRFAASLDRKDVRVVVNLSARQFLQPNLVDTVREALEKSGLLASRLELDLTEPTVMTEGEETTERLRQLRELGVQLALDDFGTGYFSIGRIRDLGFSRLKIDRSLVVGAARQRRAGRARRGHPRPGPQPRPRGRGGRRRDRGPARLPRVARLHRPPGLPAEPAPRRRRRPRLPGEGQLQVAGRHGSGLARTESVTRQVRRVGQRHGRHLGARRAGEARRRLAHPVPEGPGHELELPRGRHHRPPLPHVVAAGVDDLADLRVHVAGGPHRERAAPGEPAHARVARSGRAARRGRGAAARRAGPRARGGGAAGARPRRAQRASAARAPRRSSGR